MYHTHLQKIANRSPLTKYKTGALLIRDGLVLSAGWSHIGANLSNSYSVHAEQHALWRALHLDLRDAICYTMTIRANGSMFPAIPCRNCAAALMERGIKTVITDGYEYDLIESFNDLRRYKRPDAIRS
jgi:deoxycytidylate deaminase